MRTNCARAALPVDELPSHGLVIRTAKGKRGSLERLEVLMRGLPRPVLGRAAEKALWLDLRCLDASDEAQFVAQWSELRQ
jgi:L-seryl-tRNA(Ser) seleniumtransferase